MLCLEPPRTIVFGLKYYKFPPYTRMIMCAARPFFSADTELWRRNMVGVIPYFSFCQQIPWDQIQQCLEFISQNKLPYSIYGSTHRCLSSFILFSERRFAHWLLISLNPWMESPHHRDQSSQRPLPVPQRRLQRAPAAESAGCRERCSADTSLPCATQDLTPAVVSSLPMLQCDASLPWERTDGVLNEGYDVVTMLHACKQAVTSGELAAEESLKWD